MHAMNKQMELLERIVKDRAETDTRRDRDLVKITRLTDSDIHRIVSNYIRTYDGSLRGGCYATSFREEAREERLSTELKIWKTGKTVRCALFM